MPPNDSPHRRPLVAETPQARILGMRGGTFVARRIDGDANMQAALDKMGVPQEVEGVWAEAVLQANRAAADEMEAWFREQHLMGMRN